MLLTPTMMLMRLERGATDCPMVREAFKVIVLRHGSETVDRINDLLPSLATDRSRVLAEIGALIYASPVQDKRA